MKFFALSLLGTLVFAPAVASAQATPPATQSPTREELIERLKISEAKADWAGVLQTAREWIETPRLPFDVIAYFAQADANYKLGNIDEVIPQLNMLVHLSNPNSFPEGAEKREVTTEKWEIAQAVRRKFPTLKLQPLQFVDGDETTEAKEWAAKGRALLVAKKYDEIEETALSLQKSNGVTIAGTSHLGAFFNGLSDTKGGFAALQTRIAAWRVARPKSDLAHLASIDMWLDAAWAARGQDVASSITPQMGAKMDAALGRGAQNWKTLPKTAFESPLAFIVALNWAQLSGAPSEFPATLFASGTAKFPDYFPLYSTRAYELLPRWGGAPGEAEAMIKARADKLGGENGDVFYRRMIWAMHYNGELFRDFQFDYQRAQRGLQLLGERSPNSVSVPSARFALAYAPKDGTSESPRDFKTMQQIFSAPQGHILDTSWYYWQSIYNQNAFRDYRMVVLAEDTK